MTYNIVIPPTIQDKIRKQALYIAEDKPSAALSWYDNIYNCIYSLADFPSRCPLAPENAYFLFELRRKLPYSI